MSGTKDNLKVLVNCTTKMEVTMRVHSLQELLQAVMACTFTLMDLINKDNLSKGACKVGAGLLLPRASLPMKAIGAMINPMDRVLKDPRTAPLTRAHSSTA